MNAPSRQALRRAVANLGPILGLATSLGERFAAAGHELALVGRRQAPRRAAGIRHHVQVVHRAEEELRAVGRVLHAGRRTALAEGRLFDAANRLVAHGTTTCLVYAA